MALMITDDPATDDFVQALSAAAKRGVDVQVSADVFTYGELGGHFLPYRFFTKSSRETTSMVKRLTASGVKFNWLGRFSATPMTGRTHIKCLVVDDTVYSFGGINLYGQNMSNVDYMFSCNQPRLADDLTHELAQIVKADRKNFAYRSHRFSHGEDTIYTDGGFQGDSIIYRRVCELTRQASEVLFVSQYCPTSKLSKLLKKTKTRLYFNRPELAQGVNHTIIRLGMFFTQHKTLYKRESYLHAKFMIFTMPSGEKIAITGSHNFTYAGVLFGTREIALETRDPKIVAQLEDFFKKKVA